ncbi:unnamed protein product [Bursaphelenchus okinawaensis]|uniref:Expansin-like protein n=1 Tax=Bursaphelenchus okinawaensis TaxID=465554 RepID=A0A811KAD4_9BILA|nr:unnamed protein product [Bursaphelenchus okinawaensis]CAG9096063.1 unnamed protein product [Bursaphelenchus okinawaensis]
MNAWCLLAAVVAYVVADNITPELNTPISGGEFTFYGYGTDSEGACGLDVTNCSAAASGTLFTSGAAWVPSNFSDGRYILDDPICQGICVQIEYQGKTGVFPINNECPECAVNHVDLTTDAFLYLEPLGGTVGIATDATITYLFCNQTTPTDCSGTAVVGSTVAAASTASTTTAAAASGSATTKASGTC